MEATGEEISKLFTLAKNTPFGLAACTTSVYSPPIRHCPNHRLHYTELSLFLLSQAKVSDGEMIPLTQHEVGGREISVDNVLLFMNVAKS